MKKTCGVRAVRGDEATYEVSRGSGSGRKALSVQRLRPGLWVVSGGRSLNTSTAASEHKTKAAAMKRARQRLMRYEAPDLQVGQKVETTLGTMIVVNSPLGLRLVPERLVDEMGREKPLARRARSR